MKIKLKPFQTPNFVIEDTPPKSRQEGFTLSPGRPLREVDHQTLSDMCDAFRAEVFRKAVKEDPQGL